MSRHLLFAAMLLFPIQASAEVQTLEQALALAYEHDPGLEAQRAKLRAIDEQVSQALGNWRPSADATADIGKTRDDVANNPFFPTSTLTPHDEGVSITQPVFRGFRTVGSVRSAKATIKAGRASLQDAEQKLLLDAATVYMDVLQDEEIVEINRTNEADLQKQMNITRDRFKIGELKRTDIDQAESRLKVATAARLQAESDLLNKRTTFARLIGQMPQTLTHATLSLDQPGSRDEAISMAEQNNPAVIAANYTHESAQSDVQVAEGSLLPELNIVGSAMHSKNQNVTLPQAQNDLSIMAKLTLPLYRSGTDYSKTRAAKQTVTERREELEDAINKARETAENAWQSYIAARQFVVIDKEAMDATDKALYGVKTEAKVGTRTTLDVLNAEQELLNSRISFVKAGHDEILALLQVRSAVGTLTAEALHLPVKIYDPTINYEKALNKWVGLGIGE